MQTARRLYIYLTSFISLMMLTIGLSNLLTLLLDNWLNPKQNNNYPYNYDANYQQERLSLWAAISVVGGVVWLIHWVMAQRSVAEENPQAYAERVAVPRKFIIYLILLIAAIQIFFASSILLKDLLNQLFGINGLKFSLSNMLPALVVYVVVWGYFWKIASTDSRIAPEQGRAATVVRLYFYLVNYGLLSVLMFTLVKLAQDLWQLITAGDIVVFKQWDLSLIISDITWIVASLGGWLWHWWQMQRINTTSVDEQRSSLRKFYLYAVVLQTVVVTVIGTALFMHNLLRVILGSSVTGESLLTLSGNMLFLALIYGLFWGYHTWVLRQDDQLGGQLQTNIARSYHYIVSLVGLVVLAIGTARLMRILLDLWLGGNDSIILNRYGWGDEISGFTTLILVGVAVWYFNWRKLQQHALLEDMTKKQQWVVRRNYLYLVLFLSVLTLLSSTGTLIYQVLLAISGSTRTGFISNISWSVSITATAGVLLAYHLKVMRKDLKLRGATTSEAKPTETIILLIKGADIAGNISALKRYIPEDYQVEIIPTGGLTVSEIKTLLVGS